MPVYQKFWLERIRTLFYSLCHGLLERKTEGKHVNQKGEQLRTVYPALRGRKVRGEREKGLPLITKAKQGK